MSRSRRRKSADRSTTRTPRSRSSPPRARTTRCGQHTSAASTSPWTSGSQSSSTQRHARARVDLVEQRARLSTARSRARARRTGGARSATRRSRPRSRTPRGRRRQPRSRAPSCSESAATIFARRSATSSSVSVRSAARNSSRSASEERALPHLRAAVDVEHLGPPQQRAARLADHRHARCAAETPSAHDDRHVLAHGGERGQVLVVAAAGHRVLGQHAEVELEARRRRRGPTRAATGGCSSPSQPAGAPPSQHRAPSGRGAGTARAPASTSTSTRSALSSASSTPLAAKKSARGGSGSRQLAGPERGRSAARRGAGARSGGGRGRVPGRGCGRRWRAAAVRRRRRSCARYTAPDSNSRTSSFPRARLRSRAVEQRAEQRRPQHRLVLGHRVLEPHDARARVVVREPEPSARARRREAPAQRSRAARRRPARPRRAGAAAARARAGRRRRAATAASRAASRAPDPRDLLDQVGLARDVVAAPVRHGDVEAVAAPPPRRSRAPRGSSACASRGIARAEQRARRAPRAAGSPPAPGPGRRRRSSRPPAARRTARPSAAPRRAWPSSACSGCEPLLEAPDASVRSASRVDVRWMFGPFQFAASISTRVVPSWTSERAPPITPAIEVGPSASSITTHVGVERALLVVERGRSSRRRARGARPASRRPRGPSRTRAAAGRSAASRSW